MQTTIKQKIIPLELGSETEDKRVNAHRMAWKPAREFLKKLSGHFQALGIDGELKASDVMAKLPDLITSADDLLAHLLEHSIDLPPEEIDALDIAQVAGCIEAALELNLGDELKNSFAGIAARIGALATTKMNSGVSSTPTS